MGRGDDGVRWEPEGRYHSLTMFSLEPKGRYHSSTMFLLELEGCCHASTMFRLEPEAKRALSLFSNVLFRARRALLLFNDVPLRTRRVVSLYKVCGDSAPLVLNRTALNSNNALLVLSGWWGGIRKLMQSFGIRHWCRGMKYSIKSVTNSSWSVCRFLDYWMLGIAWEKLW